MMMAIATGLLTQQLADAQPDREGLPERAVLHAAALARGASTLPARPRCPVAVSLTPLCAPPSPTRKAEQRPYAVLQRGFASVTPAHARSHFHAMRTAMAAM